MIVRMKIAVLVALLSGTLVGCAASATEAELEWCQSADGYNSWVFAAFDSDGGWPQGLPRTPFDRQMSVYESTGQVPLTATRWVTEDEYIMYAFEYEQLSWNRTFLGWANDHPERFAEICRLAVKDKERSGRQIPSNPAPLERDDVKLARYEAFLSDMRSVVEGTPFDTWEDIELVYSGEQMCVSYLFEQENMNLVGTDATATLEFLRSEWTEVVMEGILSSHPTIEGESYEQYMVRSLGADWDNQFREFNAALTYDSSHVLCPAFAEFVDGLAKSQS